MKKLILIFLLSIMLGLWGCSTTLKATQLDDKGYFPTWTRIAEDEIKVKEPFEPKYRALLYVKTDKKSEKYNDFFIQSFKNMNVFDDVLGKEGIENLVFELGLADKIPSISDKLGFYNLQKHIGSFLVVEPTTWWDGGHNYSAEFKTIDPETGKVVLHIEKEAFNFAGLDKPLFYPLFNAFLEWCQGKSISTRKKEKSENE